MIELAPGRATPVLRALFPTEGHAYRRCFAVLDGTAGGRILTDDPRAPGWGAVQEFSDDSVLFLAGAFGRDLVAELIGALRRRRVVTVGLTADDPLLALLPSDPDHDGVDLDFEDRDPTVDLERFIEPPAGLRLARIDRGLLPRCAWGPWMVDSLETALERGLGYCLLDGELVVAEAFAGPAVEGVLEMATITHQAYRRRGLATVVCARTILECERRGDRTWWNTSLTNASSAALARKLGYRTERHYRVLAWHKAPAP
jgi:GNAT superfamily N-acetyltransferase